MATATKNAPETLLEAIRYFSDPDVALAFMVAMRWPNGVKCPRCEWDKVSFLKTRRVWKCLSCKKQFSAKVGTVLEDSAIPLEKWFPAYWMLVNCKNGISSYELGRALGVSQKSAWFMLQRLRLGLQQEPSQFSGHVEADETFIGGKARFMHKDRRERAMKGRQSGMTGKIAVMGILERSEREGASRVMTQIVPTVRRYPLQMEIRKQVRQDGQSTVYTDALKSYAVPAKWGRRDLYIHKVIDHAERYADGHVHTNGMENFWSLLKRTIKGTYVSVEPFHLFRYLDEQCYRFNQRGGNDGSRFLHAIKGLLGRRLTYRALTGSEAPQTC
jgi:transposase-like protein